jgi:hypothetical protein
MNSTYTPGQLTNTFSNVLQPLYIQKHVFYVKMGTLYKDVFRGLLHHNSADRFVALSGTITLIRLSEARLRNSKVV